tara:strand:- start:237 stop:1715 length:1479 start_codon:yes stop_codon:yes gene_type:complete
MSFTSKRRNIYTTTSDNTGGGGGTVQSVNSGTDITVDNTDPANPIVNFTGTYQDPITVVANYSALPAVGTVTGEFYWCSAAQGTSWLPGTLGGTYYNSGMYYSNGVTWEYMNVPYNATQAEVNTGTNNDKFVTPSTLTNATVITNKELLANKSTDVNTDQASNTKYTSVKSVYDWATGLFATISNLALKAPLASPTFTGTVTTPAIVLSSETASTIASFDASKNIKSLALATYPSLTELSYVKGVTSSIQTQINSKGAAPSGTINQIAYFDSASSIASLTTATYPSLTELSYVKGVTSAIQTQLNTKLSTITQGTTTITSGTSGRVGFNLSGVYTESTNFRWDNTNRWLFVDGSATAGSAAMVLSSARASGLLSSLEFNYNDGTGANSGNVVKLTAYMDGSSLGGFQFQTAPAYYLAYATKATMTNTGLWYFGGATTTPTAIITVAAGTTTVPQINLAAGVAPTTPTNGDIWFDGTDIKMRIGGTTKVFTLT